MGRLEDGWADRLAEVVLAGVGRPYPHKSGLVIDNESSLRPHHQLHPAFYGCFDWHSAVHSHWALARLLRLRPTRPWVARARRQLERTFGPERMAGEARTLSQQPGFELPYGLVWLLTLGVELREDLHSEPWARHLVPLEDIALGRLESWLRRLDVPNRSGQHDQSAFAMTLLLRWAHRRSESALASLIRERAIQLHQDDREAALHLEPSAHDFLSPTLAVAELMAGCLPARDFARWLQDFCPRLGRGARLSPASSPDRSNGKLAHRDGLNLSRAWMLRGIAGALPDGDPRQPVLEQQALTHGHVGLAALSSDEYAVTHWLPTFALYWLTGP